MVSGLAQPRHMTSLDTECGLNWWQPVRAKRMGALENVDCGPNLHQRQGNTTFVVHLYSQDLQLSTYCSKYHLLVMLVEGIQSASVDL